ncbi:MAG: carboxyl transferase domain-containing protein [Rhizomicrobium sp.]
MPRSSAKNARAAPCWPTTTPCSQGTQGAMNHRKKDRLLKVAEDAKLPIILFSEGGGGRPGDTDFPGVAGLDTPTFRQYAKLSGIVPRIGINSGRCFAGNAALLGSSDVVIATANSNIGMGGPAMINKPQAECQAERGAKRVCRNARWTAQNCARHRQAAIPTGPTGRRDAANGIRRQGFARYD